VVFDADGLTFDHFKTQKSASGEVTRFEKVINLSVQNSPGLADWKGAVPFTDSITEKIKPTGKN
jgi:hypothetical protein